MRIQRRPARLQDSGSQQYQQYCLSAAKLRGSADIEGVLSRIHFEAILVFLVPNHVCALRAGLQGRICVRGGLGSDHCLQLVSAASVKDLYVPIILFDRRRRLDALLFGIGAVRADRKAMTFLFTRSASLARLPRSFRGSRILIYFRSGG